MMIQKRLRRIRYLCLAMLGSLILLAWTIPG